MVPLLKVAAIGAAGAGICCLGWWISSISGIPPCRDLSTDSDFNTSGYTGKYALDYSKYFVGVGTSTQSEIDNTAWWDWVFQNRYKPSSNIKKGFESKTTADQLKDVCKQAYKADTDKVKPGASTNGEYEESNVWAFCSIGGNKPTTIYERTGEKESYGTGNYGQVEKNSKLLISTKDSNNDWFWNIKEVEFFTSNTYPGESSDTSSEFKKLHENRSKYIDFTSFKVRELCEASYGKKSSDTTYPQKAIFKFCSLSGKEPPTEDVQRAVET